MNETLKPGVGRAVVIGGSISGLIAAKVVREFFGEVLILERDELPAEFEPRRGVSQGRHAHGLLASGMAALEELFPGLDNELQHLGAVSSDVLNNSIWFFEGSPLQRAPSGTVGKLVSRPCLEEAIRQRIRNISGIELTEECGVSDLVMKDGRICGVITGRGEITADLVIDAAGRGSRSVQWLASKGFPRPVEESIEVQLAYTTRSFKMREGDPGETNVIVIPPTPEGKRGGVVLAQEGSRWICTLFGHFGQQAPEDLEGFREYARTLPGHHIFDLIRDAEPCGEPAFTRFQASRRRRYEQLNRFPAGFVVFGDAVCSFNPVYGQGMTVAALQAKELRSALQERPTAPAPTFFRSAAKLIDIPWSIAAGSDLKMPETVGPRGLGLKFINWYMSKVHKCAHTDANASIAFLRVAQLMEAPGSLLRPGMLARVFASSVRRRFFHGPWFRTRETAFR